MFFHILKSKENSILLLNTPKLSMSERFSKSERLCSQLIIDEVIKKGKKHSVYPFRMFYLAHKLPTTLPVQIAMVVPKRKIKLAVNRNRIKRQMREAYRKNKHLILDTLLKNEKQLAILLIYNLQESIDYKIINLAMQKQLLHLNHLQNTNQKSEQ